MNPPNGGSPESPEDLTRKQRRDQARAERKAVEEAQRASATRRRRLMQLGGIAAVVIVAVVVILVATGGKTNDKGPDKHETNKTVAEVTSLLKGIPQEHNVLGDPKAPVTLDYFGDLECPICANFTKLALPTIIDELVRTDKLKIEYHSFSTATGNAEREGAEPSGTFAKQQVAAYAAGQQSKAWYFIELFYHEQGEEDSGYVTEPFIQGIAQQVPGLNLPDWTSARGEKSLETAVEHDGIAALEDRFEGTPSFLLGKTGTKLEHFESPEIYNPAKYVEAVKSYLS